MDPDYVPDEKYLVSGKEFKKLTRNAKKLMVLNLLIIQHEKITNTWLHFQVGKKFILDHQNQDKDRRDKYLARAKKIKNKQGELTYTNPESSNFWSTRLLWNGGD